MDPIARMVAAGAAGVSGSSATYVDDVFSTTLWTGDGQDNRAITTGVDNTDKSLMWIKVRSETYAHLLTSPSFGTGYHLPLSQDLGTLGLQGHSGGVKSFNEDGVNIGTYGYVNSSGKTYVGWNFKAAPGFFDVVTYTGSGSNRTIAHNLGSVPGFIMIKRTDSTGPWICFHRSLGNTKNIELQSTNGEDTNSAIWNNTDPTSSNFTLGTNANVNGSGRTFVAYIFAHDDQSFGTNSDEAIIKCGTFNSDSNGHYTVDLGFEPQFLLLKQTSGGGGNWVMADIMRGMGVNDMARLHPNADYVEQKFTDEGYLIPEPNGFKSTLNLLGASQTFVYMAIRRPHKPPTDATEVFNVKYLANGSTNLGFVADTNISKYPAGTQEWYWNSRLTGNKDLNSNNSGAEDTAQPTYWDLPTNTVNYGSYTGYHVNYVFRRAPGFFDVVAFTGTGSSRTVDHNLGVIPELMIVKRRNASSGWNIYHETNGNTKKHYFSTGASFTSTDTWNSTSPTAQNFTVGTNIEVNGSGDTYIAYLFASLAGISKVGSYTGTGSNVDVDCGFTAGARFVLIKRTDSTGNDWYVYDTARGIASGNDPYHFINSTAVQVTNTDYIDPLNAGFTVTSSAPAALNASGGTYLFLAIA